MKKILFYIPFLAILLLPVFVHADTITYPDGCTATTKFSATTGQPCSKPACSPGDIYSSETGQKCSDINTSLPQGCDSLNGYSPLTGVKCDGSVVIQTITSVVNTPTISSQTVSPSVKLITKDLGNSYEFDAYFYDANGKSIALGLNPIYDYSRVKFIIGNNATNKDRTQQSYDNQTNTYFFKDIVDKEFINNTNTITISFPDGGISQTFDITSTIQG